MFFLRVCCSVFRTSTPCYSIRCSLTRLSPPPPQVRNLKCLGFRVPLAIVNKAHTANQLYPFAISLIESVRTYERTLEKVGSGSGDGGWSRGAAYPLPGRKSMYNDHARMDSM